MTEYIMSGVYATSFSTYTRDGDTYYRVDGWQLGRKVYRQSATGFHGSSTNPLETIGWCNHVSETAYRGLSAVMKEAFDASGHKVAPYSALVEIPQGEGYFKLGLISGVVYSPTPPEPDYPAIPPVDPEPEPVPEPEPEPDYPAIPPVDPEPEPILIPPEPEPTPTTATYIYITIGIIIAFIMWVRS